jgi:glycerol-3-phosphate dehydrogenase
MLYYENVDNRVCIMFPLLGKVLAGSTDIRVDHPDEAVTTEADIDYILESIRQVFPAIAIDRSHVVFHFCGVRPLPSQDAASTGQISRDHSCRVLPPSDKIAFPIYSLIGGKWTTFRAFAEQVADRLLNDLHLSRRASSDHLPIGGGRSFPSSPQETDAWIKRVHQATALSHPRLQTLLTRYGTHAEQVAAFVCGAPDAPLLSQQAANPERYYTRREMEYLVRAERVCHLDDIVLRRTTLALLGELTMPLLHEIARIAANVLNWTPQQLEAEIERTQHLLHKHHGVSLISNQERVN